MDDEESVTDFPQGISIARDLTKDDREAEKNKYIQTRQQNRVSGANAVPLAGAARAGGSAQASEQNRPVVQTSDHSPPHGEREPEGT